MLQKTYKITVEYDGTDFHGWQRQKNDPTVQAEIETALQKITGQSVTVTGSGRTDAGVHALAQVASFTCETKLDGGALLNALNALLPDTIVIKACRPVDATFHARFSAKRKTYRYRMLNRRLPSALERRYAWHISRHLDRRAMRTAIRHIVGTHDFSSFEGSGSPRAHARRTIVRAELWEESSELLLLEIEADGFLRHMVRNIVGTLVAVGLGKIQVDEFKAILLSRDRSRAGATAPPQGLFLVSVSY
jgi:tRNA pseudouridine38-40 synthase